jgi:hypothetical protein
VVLDKSPDGQVVVAHLAVKNQIGLDLVEPQKSPENQNRNENQLGF